MNKYLILCAVLCFISYAECVDSVTVNFLYKSDAVLDCSSSGWLADDIEFLTVTEDENGENVTKEVVEFRDKNENEKVIFEGTTMTLKDLRRPEITPEYVCKHKSSGEELKFIKQIEPFMMIPEKKSQTITEGGFVDFTCVILYGNETTIEWTWSRNDTELDMSDSAFTITQDQRHSILTISKVEESHKGMFTCSVKNKFGSASNEFQLRVKNTLAALWPFLAIVAEVLILCVIILIYERKCNKKPMQTRDDNEQSENLMGKDNHGDLKKRNPKA